MTKKYISDIDRIANEGRSIPMHVALKRIINYIQVHYAPDFPEKKFMAWVNSDSDKPFKHKGISYHWDEVS